MVATFGERRSERNLDMRTLVAELSAAGIINESDTARMTDVNAGSVHPLVFLAEQKLTNTNLGRPLDMEGLLLWLSELSSQDLYQIDPLKINVGAIAEVMSLAFAQRHKILAVEVSDSEVVIASAEPWISAWEGNLEHVLRKPIRRVLCDPRDITKHTVEFYAMARSVRGADAKSGARFNCRGYQPGSNA